ncbi:hypothetical protein FWH58_02050 [Candidatus Saccharibacteria bacterium]|nr:hypothetical protein [Candidatus Saccharibacteria bacterium]
MKDWTEEEITADLKQINAEIKDGKAVFYSLAETKKHMDETVAKLKKQQAKRRREEASINKQRATSAV